MHCIQIQNKDSSTPLQSDPTLLCLINAKRITKYITQTYFINLSNNTMIKYL